MLMQSNMIFLPTLCTFPSAVALSPDEAHGVVANARIVQEAARSGRLRELLKGRKLALLTDTDDGVNGGSSDAQALLFVRAATEMGAQVARLR